MSVANEAEALLAYLETIESITTHAKWENTYKKQLQASIRFLNNKSLVQRAEALRARCNARFKTI